MNTRDLDFFIKVYECGSINVAAEKLFITPQGLSNAISRLEAEFDCGLFNRDRAGSVPTECGEVFYRYAMSIRHDYDKLQDELRRLTRLERGVIRFAYSFGAMSGLTLDLPLEFQKKYPHYMLDYTEMQDATIAELIESGELDVGFASCSEPDRFDTCLLSESEILFVPCKSSRFYDSETVSVEDVAEEPMTLRNKNFTTTRIMRREFEKCGRTPEIILNTGGILRSIKMCREDRANTVILDSVAEQFGEDLLRTVPFREDLRWPLYMITRKDAPKSRAVADFTAFVRKRLSL